jgi:hypothetical protein
LDRIGRTDREISGHHQILLGYSLEIGAKQSECWRYEILTTSLTNTKSPLIDAKAVSGECVRATVTGVDLTGLMFRHSATILMLDGRNCEFRSKSQPELDGSILVEFEYPGADPKRRISQARVRSSYLELDGDFYRVSVELEVAQPVKVEPNRIETQTPVKQSASPIIPTGGPAGGAESKRDPVIVHDALHLTPNSIGIPQALPRANQENSAPVRSGIRELVPRTETDEQSVREAVKSAVAFEIKQHIHVLKTWISSEIEKTVPAIVSASVEKMIPETVEKQISIDRQNIIQAVHSDVARQVGERIAESVELRTALETMATTFFQEQTELSRSAGARVEQELSSRATTIIQSVEQSFAEMEERINVARADMEVALTGTRTLKQEIEDGMRPLQETFEQLNNAERAGIESFKRQADAQLNLCAAEFENQLARISAERAAQFALEVEVAMTRAQNLKQKLENGIRPLQETLEQLNNAERAGMERFQRHAAAQLSTGVAQFEEQLTKISVERAVQFSMEVEARLAPHQQCADETVDKLGAVLKLVQGTARVQQERLTEHSRATVANFEKEIRALLLRLAGSDER